MRVQKTRGGHLKPKRKFDIYVVQGHVYDTEWQAGAWAFYSTMQKGTLCRLKGNRINLTW